MRDIEKWLHNSGNHHDLGGGSASSNNVGNSGGADTSSQFDNFLLQREQALEKQPNKTPQKEDSLI